MPGNEKPRRSESKHGIRNILMGVGATLLVGAGCLGITKLTSAIDGNSRTFQALVNDCPDNVGFTQVGKEIRVGNEILKLTSVVVPQGSNYEYAICVLNESRFYIVDIKGSAVELIWRTNDFSAKQNGEKLFSIVDENKPKLSDKYTFDTLGQYIQQKGVIFMPVGEGRKITPSEIETRENALKFTLTIIVIGLVAGIPVIANSMTMSNELKNLKSTVVANTNASSEISELSQRLRDANQTAQNERQTRLAIEAENNRLRKAANLNKRGGWSSRR